MQHSLAAAVLHLTLAVPLTAWPADPPQVESTRVFDRGLGEYAAFPTFYRNVHGALVLSYTARRIASHVDSTGTQHSFASDDCGVSWRRVGMALPPAVQMTNESGHYRQITSGGWRKAPLAAVPADAIVRKVGNDTFYAQGLFLLTTRDEGRTWSREEISAPKHGALMNHNISSQLLTRAGTYLSALYIKLDERSTDQVLIARHSKDGVPTARLLSGLGGNGSLGGNETALTQTSDGRIVALIRPDPEKFNRLLIATSDDDGVTWSTVQSTEIVGYPANAVSIDSEIIVTTAQRHARPMSIDVVRLDSRTLGVKSRSTLAVEHVYRPSDFGYPITLKCSSYMLTAYYRPHPDGGAEVVVSKWK